MFVSFVTGIGIGLGERNKRGERLEEVVVGVLTSHRGVRTNAHWTNAHWTIAHWTNAHITK